MANGIYGVEVFTVPAWDNDTNQIAFSHGWQQSFHRFRIWRKTAIDIGFRTVFLRRIEFKQERVGDQTVNMPFFHEYIAWNSPMVSFS